jgi:hypothetical protein
MVVAMSATKLRMPETIKIPSTRRSDDELSNLFSDHASDGPDRRRSTREPMVTRGQMRAVTGLECDPTLEVLVVDVSLHGVGLRSAESLQVGDI